MLLGYEDDGTPVLAAYADVEALPDDLKAIDYRSIYVQGLLDAPALGALAQGAALISWHDTHRFCSRCGHKSAMADGGYKRVCPQCDGQHFPRTDPVVIMVGRAIGWTPTPTQSSLEGVFGAASADLPGSRNWTGAADPLVDALIAEVGAAPDRDAYRTAMRVLDRVLRLRRDWIPNWRAANQFIAYWDMSAVNR